MDTGDQEFEAMLQSPQFKALGQAENGKALQLQAVQEFKQFKRQNIPKADNFLSTALNAVGQSIPGQVAKGGMGLMNAVNSRPVRLATGGLENTMTLGLSDFINKKFPLPGKYQEEFYPMPENEVPLDARGMMAIGSNPWKYRENLLRMGGEAAGIMTGPAGAAYQAGEKALVRGGAGALEKALVQGLGRSVGGATGSYMLPGTPKERASHAVGGAIAGPVLGAAGDVLMGPLAKFIGMMRGKGVQAVRAKQAGVGKSQQVLGEELAQLKRVKKGMEKRGGVEETRVGRQMAAEAESGVKGKVSEEFELAKANWKKVDEASEIPSTFTEGDMLDVVSATVKKNGLLSREASSLSAQEKSLVESMYALEDAVKAQVSGGALKSQRAGVVNQTKRNIQRKIDGSNLEGDFYSFLGPKLEERGLSSMRDANKMYKEAYGKLDASKILKMPKYRAAGKSGKSALSSSEIERMRTAEQKVGVGYLEDLMQKQQGVRSKYGSGQRNLQQRIGQGEQEAGLLGDLASRYGTDAKWALGKQVGANVGAATLLSKLFGGRKPSDEFAKYIVGGNSPN